jgi:membrane protein
MTRLSRFSAVFRACGRVRVFLRFCGGRLYNRWNDDHVFFSAASLSFNVLVTILPLGLLVLSLSSLAFQENTGLENGLRDWMKTANPLIPEATRIELESAFFAGNSGIPGIVGFLALFWLVSRLFGTIRTAFDTIYEVPGGRNVFLGKLFDFLLTILVAVCFVAAIIFSTMARLITDSPVGVVVAKWPVIGGLIGGAVAQVLGTTFTMLLFFMLYKAAPNRKVGTGQAVLATVIATVFTALVTQLYVWTVGNPGWGIVYGSLASVMATFFLLYWECVILLGAAEVSQTLYEWRRISGSASGVFCRGRVDD